jgi:tetratricopeptide (TPR) repeat protein
LTNVKEIIEEAKKLEKDYKFKDAINLLEELFKKEPNSEEVKKALLETLLSHGGYLNDEFVSEHEKAIACYEKMIEIEPESYRAFYNLGISYFNLGNIEKALESYNEALKINPDYKYCYYNIGYLYENVGELEKALNFYEKALNLDPNFIYAMTAREAVRKQIDVFKRSNL